MAIGAPLSNFRQAFEEAEIRERNQESQTFSLNPLTHCRLRKSCMILKNYGRGCVHSAWPVHSKPLELPVVFALGLRKSGSTVLAQVI
jgi:hypothetical protein